MKLELKALVFLGAIDIGGSLFIYFMTVGSLAVYFSIVPTLALAGIWIPIQRTINQINRIIDKQNGKCYNCNLRIVNQDEAVLEDNNHVYCSECDHKLFGHLYYQRNGIWYKKDSKTKGEPGQ